MEKKNISENDAAAIAGGLAEGGCDPIRVEPYSMYEITPADTEAMLRNGYVEINGLRYYADGRIERTEEK